MQVLKKCIPPSGEQINNDLKKISSTLETVRNQVLSRISDFKEEVYLYFKENNVKDTERKLIERMNDVIISLTKKMADRQDTKKHIRILEKNTKNLFEILTFTI